MWLVNRYRVYISLQIMRLATVPVSGDIIVDWIVKTVIQDTLENTVQ